ncbi:MAG: hypothetical protein HYZ57_16940 [Acidobacteria bacterium]|nr:hypothetical protein [Acidobacteriota bacterium]MBI3281516.1 hypothetical protein [Acidobacteriota bacterium]
MWRHAFAIWIVVTGMAVAAGPKAAPPAGKPAAAKPVDDASLERAIRARFARSKIAANNFQVRVQVGIATIEGRTAVIQHKGTATRLARAAGARQVVNKVVITDEAREKAAGNLSKGRRRAQVVRSEPRR